MCSWSQRMQENFYVCCDACYMFDTEPRLPIFSSQSFDVNNPASDLYFKSFVEEKYPSDSKDKQKILNLLTPYLLAGYIVVVPIGYLYGFSPNDN